MTALIDYVCLKCSRRQRRDGKARTCDVASCRGELRLFPDGLRGVSFAAFVSFKPEELALLNPDQIKALFDGIATVRVAEMAHDNERTP